MTPLATALAALAVALVVAAGLVLLTSARVVRAIAEGFNFPREGGPRQ